MTAKPQYETVIIGGGAAGIVAAISAKRLGRSVAICEKTSQIGKKLLASGNGRCNLINDDMSAGHYNGASRQLVDSIRSRFGKQEILSFFKELGLETYSKEGRIFPYTNQAASVLKVLEMELNKLSIPVEYGFNCNSISVKEGKVTVVSEARKKLECENIVITGGGKSYPAYGSDGSIYDVIQRLGHTIVEPVPSGVPLAVKDVLCDKLQGQRIFAKVRTYINGKAGHPVEGELLFTKYGLSGTCIIDISETVSVAINRRHQADVSVIVDLVPFMKREQLWAELEIRKTKTTLPEERLIGILPNKMSRTFCNLFTGGDTESAVESLKNHRFKVAGTRGWNEAEFTSGGVNVDEVNIETMESKLHKGIYFAGEVLDVNGERGGYNLGWAWASGYVAGQTRHS
jgi:predicted Rossmann fold flavoprotein